MTEQELSRMSSERLLGLYYSHAQSLAKKPTADANDMKEGAILFGQIIKRMKAGHGGT